MKMADGNSAQFGRWLSHPPAGEDVVVTGISGRFPNSRNMQEFQHNLFNKIDMVSDDDRRWRLNHREIPQRNAKVYDINKLDAGFFGLHHRQANIMDPMTRKFLETAIECIVDAGINPRELQGTRTSVFIGACYADMESETLGHIDKPQQFGVTGYLRSFMANRVSYFLKLKGPSCILDTACSSSSNALELAFKSLRKGQCDNAIVGGANLLLHPGITRQFFRLGVLSTDGTCKVFDEKADGYVRGETIACIFLQRSKNARRIYGQLVYAKVNGDGFKPLGITYPSTQMQQTLMTEVLEDSGKTPSDLSFMEAHGTGTEVGDPQEVEAIDNAIARKRQEPLLTGSVKCSVGHTEPASGLCSLAKLIIAMESGYIPPNIHLQTIKKDLEGIESGRMKIVTELTELEKNDALIGLNNFGFGGNNCHMLLRRFDKVKTSHLPEDDLPRLVCVSGRTAEAVDKFLDDLRNKPLDCEYVALLQHVFRQDVIGHLHRGFAILSKSGPLKSHQRPFYTERKPLYIVFGSFENSYKNIGEHFLEFTAFKNIVKRINELLGQHISVSDSLKKQIEAKHHVLSAFAVQIGIVEILKLLQLEPTAVYGEASGKLAASYYYEELSLEDAVYSICKFIETNTESVIPTFNRSKYAKRNLGTTIQQFESLRSDSESIKNLIKTPQALVLNISDLALNGPSTLVFTKNNRVGILETLGRLYEEGYSLQLHKLYPKVQFPVSRGTRMIAPLVEWDYRKNWYTYKFGEFIGEDVTQKEHSISPALYEEHKYMTGHVIDGRNLMPATGYLQIVWETFNQSYKLSEVENLPIVFENCKFIKAVTLPKTGYARLLVSIQKSSGYFEVVEKNTVVVSGRIYSPKDVDQHFTDLPECEINRDKKDYLDQDEIYREMYLRGYNYSGLFKGVVKANTDASAALVRWEDNWVAFLDKLLQIKILQMNTRSLYVPVGIGKLTINTNKHKMFTEKQEDFLCPAYNYKECNIIRCGQVEIRGLQATTISRKKSPVSPVLEKNIFVPNKAHLGLDTSIRVNTQIVLENSLENNFKAVEIVDEATKAESELLLPLVAKALDDVPLVVLNFTVSSKGAVETVACIKVENVVLTATSNFLLIVATNLLQRPNVLNQALTALSPNGFLITREDLDFVPKASVNIVTEYTTDKEKLFLIKKKEPASIVSTVKISSGNFEWLPKVQNLLNKETNIVIHSDNLDSSGILGFVNCLRRETAGRKIKSFFLMDKAPEFNLEDPFYQLQVKKELAFNVYKDGQWGTYRHLHLEGLEDVQSQYVYLDNMVKGDLTSLRWIQSSLIPRFKENDKFILVYPYYCALNFKDIMIASGRVGVDNFTVDRVEQQCPLGFEYCGVDVNGRRVMGMITSKATASMVIASKTFLWTIPDNWSLEDASTVTVVYATVLYGLLYVAKAKPGMSILIHSATGGVGLAALNLCLYHNINIFVTVGTKEKRDYLKKHYPQIPDSHIGNSRDTSFEEMIKKETGGRGVDIVLNSLAEEKLEATVRCVAPRGHFIEIGKFDLQNNAALALLFLQRQISYSGVMLDQIYNNSEEIKCWLQDILYEGMQKGYVKPLPRTVFAQEDVIGAYKFMTTGKHIGKVIVKIRDEAEDASAAKMYKGYPRFHCNPEKTYIIIGGLGGFGLELADWLYLRGAKKLILVSRSGVQTGYQKQRINIWTTAGVDVHISTDDVTTTKGCLSLINNANQIGAIEGIFNLAVVLKDALFEDQTQPTFKTSLAPKAQATINLDQVTRQHCPNLKHFVVFSSVSCGRGNAGQTNYGMANSIMERICEKRKSDGLPGLAIQWGAIGDVGLVAKMQKENKELVIGGTLQQKISSCLDVLNVFLNQNNPVVSSMVVAEKLDKSTQLGSAVDVVSYILGIKDIKTVSHQTTFAELGMDSIMGTEMIQILEKDFDIYITAKEVRNLTFAKLIELEESKKDAEDKTPKKQAQNILKFLPKGNIHDAPTFKACSQVKDHEEAPTVFVLPGAEGVFDDLEHVTKNLNAHVLCIQYDNKSPSGCIEEMARTMLPHVEETVSKEGKFFLVAYSYGCVVGTELVKMLESKGYKGTFVAIEGAPEYLVGAAKESFPETATNEFETAVIFKILSLVMPIQLLEKEKESFLKCQSFDERIELSLKMVPAELRSEHDLKKQAVFGLANRFKSVLNYKCSQDKIQSKVYLYKASLPILLNTAEDYEFSKICHEKVQVSLLDGDHSSILHNAQLVEDINKLLAT